MLAVLSTCLVPAPAIGGYEEGFESTTTTWRIAGSDVRHQILAHQREEKEHHSGARCEHIRINAGNGTHVYFAQDVGQALVVEGMEISLWVKCDRPGIAILARVVFPNEMAAGNGQPLSALVRGTTYTEASRWQRLKIERLPLLVERQQRVLRLQHKSDLNYEGAYLDQVIVNVYGGPGATGVFIDDLEIDNYVDRRLVQDGQRMSTYAEQTTTETEGIAEGSPLVERRGEILFADGVPFVARAIQHNSENPGELSGLGVNMLFVSDRPSWEFLASAARSKLKVACPPPRMPSTDDHTILSASDANLANPAYGPVLAWHLERRISANSDHDFSQLCSLVRRLDSHTKRPLLGEAPKISEDFAQTCDLLLLSYPLSGNVRDSAECIRKLQARRRTLPPGKGFWLHVPTEIDSGLQRQLEALAGPSVPASVASDECRRWIRVGLMNGARGFRFGSRTPVTSETSKYRAAAIRLANMELELLSPWIAASGPAREAHCSQPGMIAGCLHLDHAVVLICVETKLASGRTSIQTPVSFIARGVPTSYKTYELTPAGYRPLVAQRRVAGGIEVSLERFDAMSLVLFAEHPHVVAGLEGFFEQNAAIAARLQRQLASAELGSSQAIAQQLATIHGSSLAPGVFHSCVGLLTACDKHLAAGNYRDSYGQARAASRLIHQYRHAELARAQNGLEPFVQVPTSMVFETLPAFWQKADNLLTRWPGPSVLPAGDFSDLKSLRSAGWEHWHEQGTPFLTSAELTTDAYQGRSSLHLAVRAPDNDAKLPLAVDTPPLWITSPRVRVKAGDIAKFEGWVKVPKQISQSSDGLLVFDSLGGSDLGLAIERTDGWQKFSFVRAADRAGWLQLTFALTGVGDVWLDDVTMQINQLSALNTLGTASVSRP